MYCAEICFPPLREEITQPPACAAGRQRNSQKAPVETLDGLGSGVKRSKADIDLPILHVRTCQPGQV